MDVMSHMSPSLDTTIQAMSFCVILVFSIVSHSCICIILLLWIKEQIRYGISFNKTILSNLDFSKRLGQRGCI